MITVIAQAGNTKTFDEVMKAPHNIRIVVQQLDLNHAYIKELSDKFVDGVVSVDADAAITRALDLTLFDPFKQVHLDPDSPGKSNIFITNMIKIVVAVSDAARKNVFEVPVFCGPVDKVERNDVWIDIKCLGKESLGLSNLWRGKTYGRNQKKTDVIKSILRNLMGESKLNLMDRKSKIGGKHGVKLNTNTKPWQLAKKLARTMGLQLFYDGRGVCQLRKRSTKAVTHFTKMNITVVEQPVYDLSKTINAVEVLGKKPKHKKRIKYRAVAHRKNPLSPWNLGRKIKVGNATRTVARYLWRRISDNSIGSQKEARNTARKELKSGLLSGVEVKFAGIPKYALQELDVARIDTDLVNATFTNHKFTIPLVAGDDATFGYLKRPSPKGGAREVKAKNDKSKKARR